MFRGLLCGLLSVLLVPLFGQDEVYPGDANANGIVDQYDIPYIGYAVGETGPARILTEDSQAQTVAQFWAEDFPSGPNFIHADGDGNGVVNLLDFVVWSDHFGDTEELVTPLEVPIGVSETTRVRWNNDELAIPVTGGQVIAFPLDLVIPETVNINGLAFRLRYHPSHFAAVSFDAQSSWLAEDGSGMSLQKNGIGQIDVGMTRLGLDPLAGGGTAGTLSLIVIDDMVDLLETAPDTMETHLMLEQVLLLDEGLQAVPVQVDSFTIKLYRPGTISSTEPTQTNALGATVFPNPYQGQVQVHAEYDFQQLVICDALGRVVNHYRFGSTQQWTGNDLALSSGCYFIQLEGEQGISRLRLVVP